MDPTADDPSRDGTTIATAVPPGAATPQPRSRTPFLLAVGCLSVISGLLLGVGGFFGVRALQGEGAPPVAEEEAPTTLSEIPAGPEAAVPMGSTMPLRSEALGGEVELTVSEVDWAADEEIQEANALSADADPGMKYILLTMEGTYHGEGVAEPTVMVWIDAAYVDEGGAEHPRSFVPTPGYVEDVEQVAVADGDTIRSEIVFEVPESVEGDGHFVLMDAGQSLTEGAWIQGG